VCGPDRDKDILFGSESRLGWTYGCFSLFSACLALQSVIRISSNNPGNVKRFFEQRDQHLIVGMIA